MRKQLLHFLSLFLFLCTAFATKDDPDFEITGETPKGADYDGDKPVRYSTLLTFPEANNDVWNNVLGGDEKKLSQVVKDAYWQMNKLLLKEGHDWTVWPQAMTGLAIGNEIFLSSSLRGAKSFIYKLGNVDPSHPLYVALNKCQITFTSYYQKELAKDPNFKPDKDRSHKGWPKHRYNAACGEEMALMMYFNQRANPNNNVDELKEKLKNAHMVTVMNTEFNSDDPKYDKEPLPYDQIIRYDPCGSREDRRDRPNYFGCSQVMGEFGIQMIWEDNKANPASYFDASFSLDKNKFQAWPEPISCTKP